MAKKKNLLHKTEKAILSLLDKTGMPLTTNEIADMLGISYMTAKKYISELKKKESNNKQGELRWQLKLVEEQKDLY